MSPKDKPKEIPKEEYEELLRRAEELTDKNDFNGAIKVYNSILQIQPEDVWTLWERGLVKKQKGDLNGALQDFNNVITKDPNHSYSYYQRGLIKQKRKDKKGAESDFEMTRRLRGETPPNTQEKGGTKSKGPASFEKDGRSY